MTKTALKDLVSDDVSPNKSELKKKQSLPRRAKEKKTTPSKSSSSDSPVDKSPKSKKIFKKKSKSNSKTKVSLESKAKKPSPVASIGKTMQVTPKKIDDESQKT